MAVPRLPLPSGSDGVVTLPRPLDAGTTIRIRRILSLQRAGDIPAAVAQTAQLEDTTLLGDVLADRYLSATARPDPAQLVLWLKSFAELPDAPAIYQLLSSIGHGVHAAQAPSTAMLGHESPACPLPEEADPANHAFARNPMLDRAVQERLAGGPSGAGHALRLIAASRGLDTLYASQLRAEVALHLFSAGETERALQIARMAFDGSNGRIGLAGYVAGLAAWRADRPDQARLLFEKASQASLTAASTRAGSAFWAARTHLRLGDIVAYHAWLHRAASAPSTFYGMLAASRLGVSGRTVGASRGRSPAPSGSVDDEPDDPGRPVLSLIDVDAVDATPAGHRFFALLQVGETSRAEATLRRLWPTVQTDMALCRSIQLVAEAAGLTTLSSQLAGILQSRDGQPRDQARTPVPKLSPRRGFTVDPALVYALTRLESNFDPRAVSGAGAHGLMQLMPVTAGYVLGEPRRFAGDAQALHNAGLNLELGQRYLAYLARQDGVRDDLVRLLASYNAGPNAVARWSASQPANRDPLLFIESLPSDETRDYVRRAFTYLWSYARRMKLPSPSLESLAAGQWPSFSDEQAVQARILH